MDTLDLYDDYGHTDINIERQRKYYREIGKEKLKARRLANKLEFIQRLGGVCQICGWQEHHAALEFDHKNQDEKQHDPGKVLDWVDREEAWKEIQKCRLLCSNCHRIESFENGHLGKKKTQYVRTGRWQRQCAVCSKNFWAKTPIALYCGMYCKDRATKLKRRLG